MTEAKTMTELDTLLAALHEAQQAATATQTPMYVGKVDRDNREAWVLVEDPEAEFSEEEESDLQSFTVLCVYPSGVVITTEL